MSNSPNLIFKQKKKLTLFNSPHCYILTTSALLISQNIRKDWSLYFKVESFIYFGRSLSFNKKSRKTRESTNTYGVFVAHISPPQTIYKFGCSIFSFQHYIFKC
jgi:hypothetical protein